MNTASLLPAISEFDTPHDPLLLATMELERYAKLLDLEDWIVERLRHCEQETIVNFLLGADEGRAQTITGICVRHTSLQGNSAVPLRVSREAYRNSACAEAMQMSWLCALYGVPHGGGAVALIVDPEKLSEQELHRAVAGFGAEAWEVLSRSAVIMPEGVHAVEMDWLEAALRERDPGLQTRVTGKASTQQRVEEAQELAIGIAELIRAAAGNLRQKVAVQGFGEGVQALTTLLHRKGARVIAVADESGGVAHELGLNPGQLVEHVRRHGVLLGYPEAEAVLNADVLEAECDVLVLAGGDQQVQESNVAKIRARIVIEIHARAVTHAAAQALHAAGKILVPNLLCAGPKLLSAMAEANAIGSASRRSAWIRHIVRDTWRSVADAALRWSVPVAEAAQGLAIQRVAATIRAQKNPFQER